LVLSAGLPLKTIKRAITSAPISASATLTVALSNQRAIAARSSSANGLGGDVAVDSTAGRIVVGTVTRTIQKKCVLGGDGRMWSGSTGSLRELEEMREEMREELYELAHKEMHIEMRENALNSALA
jgi:hypothetical protein